MIELIHMPMDELVADILTTPLTGWKFWYLLYKLLGWNIELHNDCEFNEEVYCTPYEKLGFEFWNECMERKYER
jgi:hypothetical protein